MRSSLVIRGKASLLQRPCRTAALAGDFLSYGFPCLVKATHAEERQRLHLRMPGFARFCRSNDTTTCRLRRAC